MAAELPVYRARDESRQPRAGGNLASAWLRLGVAVLLAIAATGVGGCGGDLSADRKERLVVAATTLPGSAPVYVAKARGMFDDEGLDVEIRTFGAGKLALDAVLRGDADVALVAETPVARAALDGQKPVVFATISRVDNANVIVGRKSRGILRPQDIRGRRVGVVPGTTADFFLHIYSVVSGLEPADVDVVSLETSTLVDSLSAGRVDAISAFAPYSHEAMDTLRDDATVLSQPGLYILYWNAATTREVAQRRRPALTRFLRALDRANQYATDSPADAQRITARGTGSSIEHIARGWNQIDWSLALDESLVFSLEDEYRWLSDGQETPDFLDYLDPRPLRAVDPSRVTVVDSPNPR